MDSVHESGGTWMKAPGKLPEFFLDDTAIAQAHKFDVCTGGLIVYSSTERKTSAKHQHTRLQNVTGEHVLPGKRNQTRRDKDGHLR